MQSRMLFDRAKSSITKTTNALVKSLVYAKMNLCIFMILAGVEGGWLWWLWVYTSLMSIFFCPPSPFAPAFDSRSRWLLWYEWTRKEVCPAPCLALIGSSSRMPWWLDHSAVLWVCQSNYSVTFKGRVSNFWKPMLIFEITETPTPQGSRPYFDRSAPHIRSLCTSSSD